MAVPGPPRGARARFDADFDVIDSPELVARLDFLARRYARASSRSPASRERY